jgi:PAS domain S-box-containing protein
MAKQWSKFLCGSVAGLCGAYAAAHLTGFQTADTFAAPAFLCALAVSLWLRLPAHRSVGRTVLARACAVTVIVLSSVALVRPLGISPQMTLGFFSLAIGLTLFDKVSSRARWPAELFAWLSGFVGIVTLFDFAPSPEFREAAHRQTSHWLGAALVALWISFILARPERGLIAPVLSGQATGKTMRRLIPACGLIPILLVWARIKGEQAGFFDREFGDTLMTAAMIFLLTVAALWNGRPLLDSESARSEAEGRLRQKAEEARRSSAFLDALLEHIPHMVFVKDAETLSFQRMNKAGELLLGVPRQELLGKSDRDFFPPEQAAFFQRKDRETLEQGVLVEIAEEPLNTATGLRWLATKKVPVKTADAQYLLGISEDITERKEVQDRLFAAKLSAELAVRELETFSYSVSHDLRAPLRSIHGFSQALIEDYAGKLDANGVDYLHRVSASAARMGQLIDDLLSLSRINRSQLTVDGVDLTALAEDVVRELRLAFPQHPVDWNVEPGMETRGDARLLRIALVNLLSNAWKFSSRTVQPRVRFTRTPGAQTPTYRVEDNGAGFDMKYADKLFAPFQRLHSVKDFEGTGVGLAIVQRVISRHGGRVWAQAQPGLGATFFFTLATATDESRSRPCPAE